MNNSKRWIAVFALLTVLLIGAWILSRSMSNNTSSSDNPSSETDAVTPASSAATTSTTASAVAPDFTVYDNNGTPVRLSSFRGKPVVLNFWASWCGPCKREMPDFEDAYKEYGDDIHFLMVNLTDGSQETKVRASNFINNSGYTFPVYYDMDLEAADTYGVYSIPVTYFIDRNGIIVAKGQGALDADALQNGIDRFIEP